MSPKEGLRWRMGRFSGLTGYLRPDSYSQMSGFGDLLTTFTLKTDAKLRRKQWVYPIYLLSSEWQNTTVFPVA
jgi:hypothetical protein